MRGGRLRATLRVLQAVLRSPSMRRVMLAFLLFGAVEYGTWIAVLLWAYDVLGPDSVGAIAVIQLVPSALFATVATTRADRFARQHVLVAGYTLQVITMGLTAAGMLSGQPPVAVVAAAVAACCSLTLIRPAHWALLPVLARTPEEMTMANGIAGSVEGVGQMAGPFAAAVVLLFAPPGAVFAAASIAAVAATLLVFRLPVATGGAHEHATEEADEAPAEPGGPATSRWRRVADSVRTLGGDPDARVLLFVLAGRDFLLGCVDVLFVLFALDVLGVGDAGAGILGAALGLGSAVGGMAAVSLAGRRQMAPVLLFGTAILGGACVILGVVTSLAIVVVIVAIAGIGSATVDVAGRTVLQRVADPRTLTRVLGSLEGLSILAVAAGAIVAPFIAEATSVPVALAVTGLALPLSIGLLWLPLRRIDRKVRVPVRELGLLRFDRILSPLPAPTLESVASGARWITLEPGEVLIREGDPGDRYYVLESGSLRITQQDRVLHEAEHDRGYGLGEIALLRDVPRTATATANEPSVLLAIARPDFLEAVTGHEHAGAAAQRTAETREPAPGPA